MKLDEQENSLLHLKYHVPFLIMPKYCSLLHLGMPSTCYLKVYGGLGNQLFQISAGLAYCEETGKNLKIVPFYGQRSSFYWNNLLKSLHQYVYNDALPPNIPIYKQLEWSYKKIPQFDGDIILDGYFQSSRYFPKSTSLLNMITWSSEQQLDDNIVIVHARRGDYIDLEQIHGPLPVSYYELAIEIMKQQIGENAEFILISDDTSFWTSPQMKFLLNEKTQIFHGNEIETLTLMKGCKNFIIANSTFSWWGAYLAREGNVIAPSRWFGPRGPQDWQDIYEDSWTIIPVA